MADVRDAPVAGARVDGHVEARSTAFTAYSDAEGTVAIEHDALALIVSASGYQARLIDRASIVDGMTVVLRESNGLVVHCRSHGDGAPRAGVSIRLSARAFGEPFDPLAGREPTPSADLTTLVHVGVSDESGEARFDGLDRADYLMDTSAEGAVLVESTHGALLTVPTDEPVVLTFADLHGGVFEVDRSLVLSHMFVLGSQFQSQRTTQARRMQADLRERYPNAFAIVVALQADAEHPVPDLGATLSLLLVDGRLVEVPVRLPRVAEIRPTPIRLDGLEVARTAIETASIVYVDAMGGNPPMTDVSLYVSLGPREEDRCNIALASGESRLPVGWHRPRSSNPWVHEAISGQEVRSPGSNVIQLGHTFRPCRIALHGARGSGVLGGNVAIQAHGKAYEISLAPGETRSVWLPVGEVVLDVRSHGYVGETRKVILEPDVLYGDAILEFSLTPL